MLKPNINEAKKNVEELNKSIKWQVYDRYRNVFIQKNRGSEG